MEQGMVRNLTPEEEERFAIVYGDRLRNANIRTRDAIRIADNWRLRALAAEQRERRLCTQVDELQDEIRAEHGL